MSEAVVLLSGGLDSTVSLAHALSLGYNVTALSFNYGQRHIKELYAARAVSEFYALKNHVIVDMDLRSFNTSALTSNLIQVPVNRPLEDIGSDIPITYVPARNIIFLSIAAGLCETIGASDIFIGANALDYSGYPDCRPEFFQAFERVLQVGTKSGVEGKMIKIQAPLLMMSKADIVRLGKRLGAPLQLTWSCYQGGSRACGRCDSCLLRLKGFKEAGYEDEIAYEVDV
ncbi:MAG: 7-cyano-7-deazaguanine synthase QueC [Methanomassiliicoccales archaeon]